MTVLQSHYYNEHANTVRNSTDVFGLRLFADEVIYQWSRFTIAETRLFDSTIILVNEQYGIITDSDMRALAVFSDTKI